MDTIIDAKNPLGKRMRRRYTEAQRRQILEEAAQPGVSVASVARRHGINHNLIFTWRKRWPEPAVRLLPVSVTAEAGVRDGNIRPLPSHRLAGAHARIEIRTAAGHLIQIGADADAQMVQLVLTTLA